jgi:MFS family permease
MSPLAIGLNTKGPSPATMRAPLTPLLRLAQVTLFVLFLADTFTYSILDVLLGRYLATLGITQQGMGLAYSLYGIFQLTGSVLILLLQSFDRVAKARLQMQYILVVFAVLAALASTVVMVLWPASYPVLLLARAIQGMSSAAYNIYPMSLIGSTFPPEWQMQAIAFLTAGTSNYSTAGNALFRGGPPKLDFAMNEPAAGSGHATACNCHYLMCSIIEL